MFGMVSSVTLIAYGMMGFLIVSDVGVYYITCISCETKTKTPCCGVLALRSGVHFSEVFWAGELDWVNPFLFEKFVERLEVALLQGDGANGDSTKSVRSLLACNVILDSVEFEVDLVHAVHNCSLVNGWGSHYRGCKICDCLSENSSAGNLGKKIRTLVEFKQNVVDRVRVIISFLHDLLPF